LETCRSCPVEGVGTKAFLLWLWHLQRVNRRLRTLVHVITILLVHLETCLDPAFLAPIDRVLVCGGHTSWANIGDGSIVVIDVSQRINLRLDKVFADGITLSSLAAHLLNHVVGARPIIACIGRVHVSELLLLERTQLLLFIRKRSLRLPLVEAAAEFGVRAASGNDVDDHPDENRQHEQGTKHNDYDLDREREPLSSCV